MVFKGELSMICKKCGKEIREGNIFCTNCGYSINEEIKASKSNKTLVISITAIIIILITIVGIIAIKNLNNDSNLVENEIENSNNGNNLSVNEQVNQQIEDEEIDIKLYDVNNNKPSKITLDDTSETGAVYNFTIDDFKEVLQNVCETNNMNFKVSENTEEIYTVTIEVNEYYFGFITLAMQNNKMTGLAYGGYGLVDSNKKETINYDEICNNIIIKLLGKEYVDEIIKSSEELASNEYRYTNYTMLMKMDLDTFYDFTEQDIDLKEYVKMDILMLYPMTEELYDSTNLLLNSMKSKMQEEGISITENSNGSKFEDINSISYIKFISEAEFEMMLGEEGSEAFIKTGSYSKNGNIVTLYVTYDSELEPSEYNGITEPFSPYEIQMNVMDTNTLKYTDSYNSTYIFQK